MKLLQIEADEDDGMFGVFGFIGTIPNSDIFKGSVEMDERGYIQTDADMHTNIPGVYAAGDVRVKSLRQVVTAAADGAIAAVQVERSMANQAFVGLLNEIICNKRTIEECSKQSMVQFRRIFNNVRSR